MNFKLIFNANLQDWYQVSKNSYVPILLKISQAAFSAGYRLFLFEEKIYHCFRSGGVVGYVKTGAKDGDEYPVKKSRIFEADPDKYRDVEFALKNHCLDAIKAGKNFVRINGSVYYTNRFNPLLGIFPMLSTDYYYNEEILISLCVEGK